MISPTVGRVVWVWKREGQIDTSQPEAALVTYVHNDRLINVAGFTQESHPFREIKLLLEQEEDEPSHTTHASWMPYQIGQAKKHA